MKRWGDGAEDRKESLRRFGEALSQFGYDMLRSWRIYRRSFLAVVGLLLVLFVSTISYFADEIAVEHPYTNTQETQELWSIDYEPRRAHPFSEECDWHEQSISLTTLRRNNETSVVAESDNHLHEKQVYGYHKDILTVIEFIELNDNIGYSMNMSLLSIDPDNASIIHVSQELFDNMSHTTVWITYEFDNSDMHVEWMPEGYQRCIFGTNNQGQDMFSKVLYGSRVSLKIGITVAMITVTIGTIVGSISGYFGGRIDEVIMRICDIFFAVPGLILAMAFVTAMSGIESFTMPVSFMILFPLFFLAFIFRSYSVSTFTSLDETIESLKNSKFSLNWLLAVLAVLLIFEKITGMSSSWHRLFDYSESLNWRLLVSMLVIVAVTLLAVADKKFIQNTSFAGAGQRLSDSMDWTNPWKYLTLRTALIFLAAWILWDFSGTSGDEIVIIKNFDRLWKIQFALIFTGWPGYARLIRGQVLYVKEMTFVEAARSVGAPSGRIMFRHILPNAWAPLMVAFTLDIGGTILSASGLSFIGLGAPPGTAEWGILVSESRQFFLDDPHLMLFPGLAIAATTLGFNLLGDGLRDVVDPKNRR